MRWRSDPVQFVRDNFKEEPDMWQAQALRAFADPAKQRISLQACAGPGKTAVLAWCGLNFMSCYAGMGEHPKAAAVSITSDNLRDNLWPELAKWQERSEYLRTAFRWTSERFASKDHYKTWFMSARTFSKTANDDEQGRTLSGLHSKFILYLIDESGDISPAVLRSAEQGLSNCYWGKIVQAGNPTSDKGMLYQANEERDKWEVIEITGDPDKPNRSKRISLSWAQDQVAKWGRDNPWVMAYILGQFPPSALNALMGRDDIDRSIRQNYVNTVYHWSQIRLGVDVARYGDDSTVIFCRQGLRAGPFVEMKDQDTMTVASRVALAVQRTGAECVHVDGIGVGAGVVDRLKQLGIRTLDVQSSSKPDDPRYYNKRAEIWYRMAEWVKRGGWLPDNKILHRELLTPTYTLKGGRIIIEDKAQIKERLKKSTDMADALAMTFSTSDQAQFDPYNALSVRIGGGRSSDWDPINKPGPDYDPMERGV